jgi:hypothetical protein
VIKALLVIQEHKVSKVFQEYKAFREIQEQLVSKAQLVIQEHKVSKDLLAIQAHKVLVLF